MRRFSLLVIASIVAITATSTPIDTTYTLSKGVKLSDVVVYGSKDAFGVNESQMSALSISKKQVLSVPMFFGEPDVMKTLQRLPGVQAQNDGSAGILVRGGNYDQNLITLDGSTLYNGEHLKGYVSAINPDVVNNINFYRGAFPARYGSRLSSVVDIGIKTGDFNRFHGNISLGLLASRIQLEGPLWKDHTSFNVAARVSYFDMVAYRTLGKYYDKPESMKPYSDMDFFDINAKIVHKFNNRSRLSAVLYYGKDWVSEEPTKSSTFTSTFNVPKIKQEHMYEYSSKRENAIDNSWGNIVSSIYWTHQPSNELWMNLNLSYSQYKYQLTHDSYLLTFVNNPIRCEYWNEETSKIIYHSDVHDVALTYDTKFSRFNEHLLRFGGKFSVQNLNPTQDVMKHTYGKRIADKWQELRLTSIEREKTIPDYWMEKDILLDTILGRDSNIYTATLYAEDDWAINSWLKANVGLRLSLYSTT